jgi:hypothetical protein
MHPTSCLSAAYLRPLTNSASIGKANPSGPCHGSSAEEAPHMDPELLGAVVRAVKIGFILILFALLLYASGMIR